MKLKIYTNKQLDIVKTAKVYAGVYAERLAAIALKGVDKLDYYIVNH